MSDGRPEKPGGAASTRLGEPDTTKGERPPDPLDRGRVARAALDARAVGRRFLAAFTLFEIGRLNARVAQAVEATSVPRFALELLSAPPRVPRRIAPRRARVLRLEFVPGLVDTLTNQLRTAQLVGTLARGDRTSSIAIDLVASPAGWRVTGVGR